MSDQLQKKSCKVYFSKANNLKPNRGSKDKSERLGEKNIFVVSRGDRNNPFVMRLQHQLEVLVAGVAKES